MRTIAGLRLVSQIFCILVSASLATPLLARPQSPPAPSGTKQLTTSIGTGTVTPNQRYCPPDDPEACEPVPTNKPPIITWAAYPVGGTWPTLLPTDTIALEVYASDPDGTISRVTFILDGQVVATDAASPYQTSLSHLAGGTHTVYAVAYDNLGRTTSSSAITLNVRNSVITGNIDSVSSTGLISGWACSTWLPQSINVDLYLGGPAGSGTGIARYLANVGSEAAVASACSVSSGSYRFQIQLSNEQCVAYSGATIYIHGISPIGAANNLLSASGNFRVPVAVRNAQFAAESYITTMQPGQTANVTVQMRNNGNYTWTAANNFRLGSQNPANNATWGVSRVSATSDVAPGQTGTFNFTITAPTTPGTYSFQWRMVQDGVEWFGDTTPNMNINVRTPVRNAQFVSQAVTGSMTTGHTQSVSIQMRNNGDYTWSSGTGFKLGSANPSDNGTWGLGRVALASDVAPGQTATFNFTITAPSTPGSYIFEWQMLQEGVAWFGDHTTTVGITVSAPPPVVAESSSIAYDELGRVIARYDSAGQLKASYQYDANGNLTQVTDALDHVTQLTYDALDRIKTSTDAAGHTTQYAYDIADRLIQVTDPRGNATRYTYDGFGQLWQQASPDTGTTSFAFDAGGLLQSMTRADGVQTTYGYDGLNRPTDVTANGVSQTATYDNCANGIGRLCTVSDTTGTTSYGYTPEGDVAVRGFLIAGTGYSLGYIYDGLGRISTVTYPDGNTVSYSYANGLTSGVTLTSGGTTSNLATAVSYRAGDQAFASWTSSNGLSNTLSYDGDGRLTGISVPGVQNLAFGYDAADRITRITNGIDGTLTQTFEYDPVSRLTSVTSTADNQSFQYDASGNRTLHVLNGTSTSYGVAATSNRLASAGSQTFGYDANGNTTTVGGTPQYHYDVFNRMDSAGGMNYYVNPEGQRLRKAGSLGTTYFAPDKSGPLLAEYASGGWIDYVWLNGRLIGRVAGGQAYAVHTDQVGRPEAVTDASKSVVWWAQNFAFDRKVVTSGITLNLGFPGQYYDSEAHLWNNGFRDFSAETGRYIESDPLGILGGINTYAYALDNPLFNTDPLGLITCHDLQMLRETAKGEAIQPVYPELYVFGFGRLLYAAAARLIPLTASSMASTEAAQAAWAVTTRNSLKTVFRLGLFQGVRQPSVNAQLAKYGGDAAKAVAAAGRTNSAFNTAGAAAAAGAVAASHNGETDSQTDCPCK